MNRKIDIASKLMELSGAIMEEGLGNDDKELQKIAKVLLVLSSVIVDRQYFEELESFASMLSSKIILDDIMRSEDYRNMLSKTHPFIFQNKNTMATSIFKMAKDLRNKK
jgi:hypothetical protein